MTDADTRSGSADEEENTLLEPSAIADVVNFSRCKLFTDLRFVDKEGNETDSIPYEDLLSEQPVSVVPVLGAIGDEYEIEVYDELVRQAERVFVWPDINASDEEDGYVPPEGVIASPEGREPTDSDVINAVEEAARGEVDGPILLLQTHLEGTIGGFDVWGQADLIAIWPDDESANVRAFDIKAGEEKPHHQVQAGIYGILLDDLLTEQCGADYELSTGIIDGETDTTNLSPDSLPQFSYESAREDIKRLLRNVGVIADTFSMTETPPHDLGKAAQESEYTQVYYMLALEERDIRLLDLSVGAQRAFENEGLETLEDVAELIEPPEEKPKTFHDPPKIREEHEDTARALNENPSVNERVQLIAQRAQNLLGTVYPSHPYARDDPAPWELWLQGSGKAALPEDDPYGNYWGLDDFEIVEGGLIRVYVDVQYDYFEDRLLMLNAVVDCTASNLHSTTVSATIDEIPSEDDEYEQLEADLISNFVVDLFDEVRKFNESVDGGTSPHFYFYTEGEHDHFLNAIDRHGDKGFASFFHRMFDLRPGLLGDSDVEQPMTSIVQPIIREHLALTEPGASVPKVLEEVWWGDFEDYWTHARTDGEEVNLKKAFEFKFCSRQSAYVHDENGTLSFDIGNREPDGFCTTLPRFDSQLPLEYFWGADGMDAYDLGWLPNEDDEPSMHAFAQNFRYVTQDRETRIKREDLVGMGERLSDALRKIERQLDSCRTAVDKEEVRKKPLPTELPDLDDALDAPGDATLKDGVVDYLDLEHAAEREDIDQLRETPVRERILMGRSVPVEITDVDPTHDVIEARLAYDTLEFSDPGFVEQACRIDRRDRVLATHLRKQGGEYRIDDEDERWDIQKAPVLEVLSFNSDETPQVVLDADTFDGGSNGYEDWNYSVKTSPDDEYGKLIQPGDLLVLDVKQMTIGRQRSRSALKDTGSNHTYHLFDEILQHGVPDDRLETDLFDADDVEGFVDEMGEASTPQNALVDPNEKQREFVCKTDARISLLQGPPGTGKTKGALSPTLLSRASTRADAYEHFRALVTAPTHTAIKEVMEEVATMSAECRAYDVGSLDNLGLVRVVSSDPDPDDEVGGVTYVNYNDSESLASFADEYQTVLEHPDQMQLSPTPVIVFATPQGAFKLAKELTGADKTEDAFATAPDLFDLMAVDEASMFTLPQLFMAGAFVSGSESQYILAGDHRQMPPVQHHEWTDERRFSATETVSYLSALNYCRFLRGDAIERVERHDHAVVNSPEANIAYTGLERTYRSHETVTDFLRHWVYAQDGIRYYSEEDDTIDIAGVAETPGLEAALTEAPLVLIAHDDRAFQQMNPTEAAISEEIVDAIPTSEDIGIVTPHNAQKALLRARCNDVDNDLTVDTVERFQGGEKDAILISATVSDPEYLDAESDFILNPNRLNVALSRMKKKLVVIAPESLFEMIPADKETYEDAQIWKGLYQTVSQDGPAATGTVTIGDEENGFETEFRVYTQD